MQQKDRGSQNPNQPTPLLRSKVESSVWIDVSSKATNDKTPRKNR